MRSTVSFEPPAALVTGQQGRCKQGEVLAPQPRPGFHQRLMQRLAQVVFGHDLVEFGLDRLRALAGEDLHGLGQRKAGPHRVGQHHHGVGQLVFDLRVEAGCRRRSRYQGTQINNVATGAPISGAVQHDPAGGHGGDNHRQPGQQQLPQVGHRGPQAAELVGEVAFHQPQGRSK